MSLQNHIAGTLTYLSLIFISSAVVGQEYPHKPVRIVIAAAGGGTDFPARIIAQELPAGLGAPIIVDNRSAFTVIETVTKAQPDGYTLLLTGSVAWITPLMQKTPYDPIRDLAPITLVTATPLVLAVHPSMPVNSVKELIALAKAKPGVLNYGSSEAGASSHLGPELFKAMTGVDIMRVPYKGSGPALNALIAAEVQLMISNAGSTMPHVKSGKLKALAVTSAKPSALLPGLPTIDSTVPGYEFEAVFGMFTTTGTPAPIIKRLNQEIVRVLNRSDVKQKFFNGGSQTIGSSPEAFAARIKTEMARLGKVIKDAGIRADS